MHYFVKFTKYKDPEAILKKKQVLAQSVVSPTADTGVVNLMLAWSNTFTEICHKNCCGHFFSPSADQSPHQN